MITTLVDRCPFSGRETWHHYDPATDVTTVEERLDVQPILELNAQETKRATNAPVRAGVSHLSPVDWEGIQNGFHHVARIDAVTEMEWKKEGIDIWRWGRCDWTTRKMKLKLNSPEWRRLRIGTARV